MPPGDLIFSVVASPTPLEEADSLHASEDIPGDCDADSVNLSDVDSDGDDMGGEAKEAKKAEQGKARVDEGDEGDEGEEGKEGECEGKGEGQCEVVEHDTQPHFQEAWTDSQPPASPEPLLNTPAHVPGNQCCSKRLPADGVSCIHSDLPVEDWCCFCRDQLGDDLDPEEIPLSQNKDVFVIEDTPVKKKHGKWWWTRPEDGIS